jgi:hypothetical protein
MKEARKGFFFEKKKQKTFFNLGRGLLRLHATMPFTPSTNALTPRLSHQHGAEERKFFCCFFFKKSSAYFLKTATP